VADEDLNTIMKIEPASPLPTVLLDFRGSLENGTASLSWQSGVEANLNHYELEKSIDGKLFSFLGRINAKGSNSSYVYSTAQVQSDQPRYYRLKMIDNDGHPSFSDLVVLPKKNVPSGNINPITIYPVPAKNNIFIKALSSGRLNISDGTGRAVMVVDLKAGLNHISIQQLKAGVYYAKFKGQSVKFIKK